MNQASTTPAASASFVRRAFSRFVRTIRGPDAAADQDLASYRLLVGSLFSSPASIFISNIVGVLVPFFCWFETGAADLLLVRRRRRYHCRASGSHGPALLCRPIARAKTGEQVKAWDREYFLGATAFSTILGLNCFFALAFTGNVASHIITIVSGIAFSSGYVARNAGRPNFVIVQLLSFCIPMSMGLFASPGASLPGDRRLHPALYRDQCRDHIFDQPQSAGARGRAQADRRARRIAASQERDARFCAQFDDARPGDVRFRASPRSLQFEIQRTLRSAAGSLRRRIRRSRRSRRRSWPAASCVGILPTILSRCAHARSNCASPPSSKSQLNVSRHS